MRNIFRAIIGLIAAISLIGFLTPSAAAAPASGNRQSVRLDCRTITAPKIAAGKLPTRSCDDLCKEHDAVCVWNADNLIPHTCETPVDQSSCRCCSIVEPQ